MSPRADAEALRELLRGALHALLSPAGWEPVELAPSSFRLLALRRPIDESFAATASVSRASQIPDRPPVTITGVTVGISYEPLRALSPLLGLHELDVLRDRAWPGDDERGANDAPLEVRDAAEAARAADRLSGPIAERSMAFAESRATLETLLDAFPAGRGGVTDITRAALLAAAGRIDEADAVLGGLPPLERSLDTRRTRRAARQLRRYIDSGGDRSIVPDRPPPNAASHPRRSSLAETWAESRAHEAAIPEVRETARGRTREEARAMLDEALSRRGSQPPSPLWIESRLDHLWDTRADQIRTWGRALEDVARFGLRAAQAIRDHELPDLSTPDWLEPPDHALYGVPASTRWSRIELDPDAGAWLDRVHDAMPKVDGVAFPLTAWLRRTDVIEVHLGERGVGRVAAADAAGYVSALADAAARDEHPYLTAHLARREDGYLLELAVPMSPTSLSAPAADRRG